MHLLLDYRVLLRSDYIHSDSSIFDILVLWVQVTHSSCVLVASSCHGRQQTPQIGICHGIHKLAHPSRFERMVFVCCHRSLFKVDAWQSSMQPGYELFVWESCWPRVLRDVLVYLDFNDAG